MQNIQAATAAFAAILDGPNKNELAKVVRQAFTVILQHVKDENDVVKVFHIEASFGQFYQSFI